MFSESLLTTFRHLFIFNDYLLLIYLFAEYSLQGAALQSFMYEFKPTDLIANNFDVTLLLLLITTAELITSNRLNTFQFCS